MEENGNTHGVRGYVIIQRNMIEIAIPALNEELSLGRTVEQLRKALDETPGGTTILIADNGSADNTWTIARELESRMKGVRAIRVDAPGRGRALTGAWLQGDATVMAYMDADLSTSLECLPSLLQPLLAGQCDIAIGSRLIPGAQVQRSIRREVLSRGYNFLLRHWCGAKFSDAQCGFKAITRSAARHLLPLVEDTQWFWDSELLLWAQHLGYRILEVPVRWCERRDSRVRLWTTILQDLQGMARMRKRLRTHGKPGRLLQTEGISA